MRTGFERMRSRVQFLFELALDFLLPRSETVMRLEAMSPAEFSEKKARALPTKSADLVLYDYRDPDVRALIWEIKYRGNRKLAQLAATLLYDELLEALEEERMWENFVDPILLPIPLSKKRRKERGFNQVELLSEALLALDGGVHFTYRNDILEKTRHTESQTKTKNKEERRKNLANCYAVRDPNIVSGRNIILLDDVVTTGATLHEAKRTLKNAGARRVFTVAIAH